MHLDGSPWESTQAPCPNFPGDGGFKLSIRHESIPAPKTSRRGACMLQNKTKRLHRKHASARVRLNFSCNLAPTVDRSHPSRYRSIAGPEMRKLLIVVGEGRQRLPSTLRLGGPIITGRELQTKRRRVAMQAVRWGSGPLSASTLPWGPNRRQE